ncbi:MAG: hypothetical protein ACTSSE_18470 [Candidatus Thorarchaeota archaeon]|jgi:hypothetical protein
MKSIKNVKLGFNKNAEVTVVADIEMKDAEDIDSLFLCFFTILNPPLRLSVITSGAINEQLSQILGQSPEMIEEMMKTNAEMYSMLIQQNTELMLQNGEEQNKIELNSASNSANASAILTSMLKNGFYIQKTRYYFPNGDKERQEQKVDVSTLKQAFKAMLEICKRWDDPELLESLNHE